MRQSTIIIYVFLCLPVVLNGQAKLLLPHILSTTEGLSDNINEFMYRDSRSFMWYSSSNGLNRFDGTNVKVYKPNSKPNSMNGSIIQSNFFEDTKGNLWFCTYNAINCYRRQTDDFASFQISLNQSKIVSDYYAFFLEKNQKLWLLIRGQVIRFDINTHQIDTLKDKLHYRRAKVFTNSLGEITTILGYKYGGSKGLEILIKDKNNQFQLKKHEILPPFSRVSCAVNDMAFDNTHNLWLATNNGLLLYDLNTKSIIDSVKTQNTRLFSSIYKTSDNHLVGVSKNNGIYIFNHFQNNLEEHFEPKDYPRFASFQDSYLDNMSNLWVSEWYKGITYFNLKKSKFRQIFHTVKEENKTSIHRIIEDKEGHIWSVNNTNLVYLFDKKNNKTTVINLSNLSRESKDIEIRDLICDNLGRILIFTKKDIYVFSSTGQFIRIKSFPSDMSILYAKRLLDNKIFISSVDSLGLLELNSDFSMSIVPIQSDMKIEKKDFLNIYESKEGLIFVNFNQESILILKKTVKGYKLIKKIECSSLDYIFYEPKEDKNILWIGTSNGLLKFDKEQLKIIDQIDEEKGLPNQIIKGILPLSDNKIMLSTGKGLVSFNTQNHETHRFTVSDGLQDEQFNSHAFLKASDGTFWFGGLNGINFFHPKDIKLLDVPAYPHIVNLKVNDEPWEGKENITEVKELIFPYSQRTLTFDLVSIEYSDPQNNLIQFRLKNYDEKWLTVKNTEGAIRYANLPYGTYYLQVKAANSDGVWNETIRELKITILTPWYLSWWFISLSILAIMLLIGYILYLRISKIIDLQEIRINLYENLHDDLGSRLTAVVMSIDIILNEIKNPKIAETKTINEPHVKMLNEIRGMGSRIVGNMHLLVWATNPGNDELSNVVQQMRNDKEILLPKAQLDINISEELTKLKVDGNKRYQLLSIFDEALTNISKYAEANIVTTDFNCTNDIFSMRISDNGKGFDTQANRQNKDLSGGNGFRNMRNRAKRINGQLAVTSQLGEGTSIFLTFSLLKPSFFKRLKAFFSKFSPK